MLKHGCTIPIGVALFCLAGCQNGGVTQAIELPQSARLRTAAEMRQAVGPEGLTSWGHDLNGNKFVSYASPDGITKTESGSFADTGTWHATDNNKFCIKWHKIRSGAETCLTQYDQGNDIYSVLPDGKVVSVVTRSEPGNPMHL